LWCSHAKCDLYTKKCDFHTHECNFDTCACEYDSHEYNFQPQSMLLHAKCDFHIHECNFDTWACVYDTREWNLYTKSAIPHAECDFYTYKRNFYTITTCTGVIYTRTRFISTRGENFFNSPKPWHPCYPNGMKLFVVTFADAKSLFSEF
jgi:hypothetical protein